MPTIKAYDLYFANLLLTSVTIASTDARFCKTMPVFCNNRQIQSIRTTECGWFCLICDYILEYQKSGTYLDDYGKFLNLWYDDTTKNLTLLKKIFKPL